MPRKRPAYRPAGYRRPAHNVPVNLAEHADHFTAHVYCTPFTRDDLSVSVVGDTLYISGRREPAEAPPEFLLQEFPVKRFERSFQLSERADREAITARVDEGGVLVVTVPKVAGAQAREIEVPVG